MLEEGEDSVKDYSYLAHLEPPDFMTARLEAVEMRRVAGWVGISANVLSSLDEALTETERRVRPEVMVFCGLSSVGDDFFASDGCLLWCLALEIDLEKWLHELEICNDVIFPESLLSRYDALDVHHDRLSGPKKPLATFPDAVGRRANTSSGACCRGNGTKRGHRGQQ